MTILNHTVDGSETMYQLILWRIYHYLQAFIDLGWLAGFPPSISITSLNEVFIGEFEHIPQLKSELCKPGFVFLGSFNSANY